MIAKKLVSKEGEYFIVNAKKLKFNKLLGKGKLTKKFKIDVPYASKKAIESVQKAGGIVNCKKKEELKTKKEVV